jgi:hypothetical protein
VSSLVLPWQRLLMMEILQVLFSQSPVQNSTQLTHCSNCPSYNFLAWTTQKTLFFYCCVHVCCHGNMFTELLPETSCITPFIKNLLPQQQVSLCDHYPAMGLHATI